MNTDINTVLERLQKRKAFYERQIERIEELLGMDPESLRFFAQELNAVEQASASTSSRNATRFQIPVPVIEPRSLTFDKNNAGGADHLLSLLDKMKSLKVLLPTNHFLTAAYSAAKGATEEERKTIRLRVSNTLNYLMEKRKKAANYKMDNDHMKTYWGPHESVQGEGLNKTLAEGWHLASSLPVEVMPEPMST